MVPLRRRLGRILTILALVFAVGVFAIALPGCGSSDDETSPAPTVSDGGTAPSSDPAAPGGGKQDGAKADRKAKPTDRGGSEKSDEGKGDGSKPRKGQGQPKQGGGHQDIPEGSPCPEEMTRAECKSRIETQTGGDQDAGAPVTSPSHCTEVMTEEQCREILEQQKEESAEGGSVSPQTCLEEYSREFCEERFGEAAERQAGQ